MLDGRAIETVVERAFPAEPMQLLDYRLSAYSSTKLGFLSEHRSLHVTLRPKKKQQKKEDEDEEPTPTAPPTLTRRYFVKSLPETTNEQEKFLSDRGVFELERGYYEGALPLLRRDFLGASWCPQCYWADERSIVLEDMGQLGFRMHGRGRLLDARRLRAAARAQARLHAASLVAEARLGETLPRALAPRRLFVEQIFCKESEELSFLETFAGLMGELAQRRGYVEEGEDTSVVKERMRSLLERGFASLYEPGPEEAGARLGPVLCHGDTWANNYLFSDHQDTDADTDECAIMVDFQLARYAPRTFDLAQLVRLSTTREQRARGVEAETLRAYHAELCGALEANEPGLGRPSLGELRREYESLRLAALFACNAYLPVICLGPEILKTIEVDELYRRVMLRTDNEYVLELCARDREYEDALAEVALDLVEYGKREEEVEGRRKGGKK